MRSFAFSIIFTSFISVSFAQTIFTYGNKAVSKAEFLDAFNKNPNATSDRRKALKEYLGLYVNFKLKVQAAYDAGLDKDPSQLNELDNFRRQLTDNIINQQANLKGLVTEAFYRSQKDIHIAQVFVEVSNNLDTVEAYNAINKAYAALKGGKEFSRVAEDYSTDVSTKRLKGDLGFITAFTLPYQFESVAYSLKPTMVSAPFRSTLGYHIFKNIGERTALGSRRVGHILIAVPPDASAMENILTQRKADSIYSLLIKGSSFDELSTIHSNDINSAGNNGMLPEFGINTYDPQFEQVAFALAEPGEISKPFMSSAGYHILKLIEAKPVVKDIDNTEAFAALENKVSSDARMAKAKKLMLAKQLKVIGYKTAAFNLKHLYDFTDSAISKALPLPVKGINEKTPLFSFAKKIYTAGDWLTFIRGLNIDRNVFKGASIGETYQQFLEVSSEQYYREHLEEYSTTFKKQLKEFKEANMLFGIMEKQVWAKANEDTAGLKTYYEQHKGKYIWAPSADAIIITSANEALAKELEKRLTNNVANWRQVTEGYSTQVNADSGRYELGQLPVIERTNFTTGLITHPVKNTPDGTYSFNYIIKVYNQPSQRNFEEALGMVINDYQEIVEERWLADLKKRYPVNINTDTFNSIK